MDTTPQNVGPRLKLARENRGLSVEAAAGALGRSTSELLGIESGTQPVSTLELAALAEIYQRDVGWFLGEPNAAEGAVDPPDEKLLSLMKRIEEEPERFSHAEKEGLASALEEAYRNEEISRGRLLELSAKLGLPGAQMLADAEPLASRHG